MRFSILTLFPDSIAPYGQHSLLGKAQQKGLITIDYIDPRRFTQDAHRKVDDTPYGGGAGMVLACQPFHSAYESLLPLAEKTKVVVLSPAGPRFTQTMACQWAQDYQQLVLFCGHYEGFDHRLFDVIPNLEPVCVGDFVVTGGELPAMLLVDAVSRHIPGVVQQAQSVQEDSFNPNSCTRGLLDYPHYTRPAIYQGHAVPEVLTTGNHAAIAAWRTQQALEQTRRYRPDLLP